MTFSPRTYSAPLSWQAHSLKAIFGLRRALRRQRDHNADTTQYLEQKRTSADGWTRWLKPAPGIDCGPANLPGLAAEWIRHPAYRSSGPVMLHLHGGSYTGGSITSHRPLVSNIARVTRGRALLIEYRLAPEHPFPAALDDAVMVYRWLLQNDIHPQQIVISGDSSGGGLALAALLALRDGGQPLPAAAVCISPWTDMVCDSETWVTNEPHDVFANTQSARRSAKMYLNGLDPRTPLASPLYADLGRLPPILIQVGSEEVLLNDSVRFAEKAHQAGVDVRLEVWKGMTHGWHYAAPFLPEGRAAIEAIGKFIVDKIGRAG
ncbi:alpha/beta hydrolase [Candidatus Kaiserbacteria bacterium]|nr:alpha/beta hydrolase [Candidatus Kaiserbacteria bacterium]